MKSIDEMCAVMQAFKEGKTIEYRSPKGIGCKEWIETDSPIWDWDSLDYRIKPEPKYVPYDSVSEIDRIKWVRKKDVPGVLRPIAMMDTIINGFYISGYGWVTTEDIFEKFEYEDGTPCGKREGEQK